MPYKNKDKQREYNRRWLAARRSSFFKDKKCINCGSCQSLELDHVNPDEKVTHRIWSWSEKKRNIEIKKCQVLCSSCHKKKTRSQRKIKAVHPSKTTYNNGCRCLECKRVMRDHFRQYRARKK